MNSRAGLPLTVRASSRVTGMPPATIASRCCLYCSSAEVAARFSVEWTPRIMSLSSTWASTDRMKGSLGSPFCSSTLGVPGISTRNPIWVLRYSFQAGVCAHAAVDGRANDAEVAASPTRLDTRRRRDQFGPPNTGCDDVCNDMGSSCSLQPSVRSPVFKREAPSHGDMTALNGDDGPSGRCHNLYHNIGGGRPMRLVTRLVPWAALLLALMASAAVAQDTRGADIRSAKAML